MSRGMRSRFHTCAGSTPCALRATVLRRQVAGALGGCATVKGKLLPGSRRVTDRKPVAAKTNPIATLVDDRMTDQGWSTYDVHRQGGPPAKTVGHWRDHRVTWQALPKVSTVEAMAKGLRIPLARVQQAVLEAVGYEVSDVKTSTDVRLVAAAMTELSPAKQKHVADMVLRMVEALADDAGGTRHA